MATVEPLASHHDRKSFDCGKDSLNEFLKTRARQNADRNVGVTHVVVPEAGASQIMGYYTLLTRTVERNIIPVKSLPSGPVRIVLLGRAVDKGFQRQGLGQMMLLRAMRQTDEASRTIGIYGLVLDALDEDARKWYLSLGWGFEALTDSANHLFLPVDTIRSLSL